MERWGCRLSQSQPTMRANRAERNEGQLGFRGQLTAIHSYITTHSKLSFNLTNFVSINIEEFDAGDFSVSLG